MDDRLMWLNGQIIKVRDAKINVLAPTSQFGLNVFEGIRCYYNKRKGKLYGFRLKDHYERLLKSVKLIRLNAEYTLADYQKYMFDVVKANGYKEDIAVRQTVFCDGFGTWSSKEQAGMFIAPIAKERTVDKEYSGLKIKISSWQRISDLDLSPRAKVGANYINSRMAQLEALDSGFDTAVLMNMNGKIAEAVGSCIFIVRDNTLITPPFTAGVLESITRDTVLELAKRIDNLKVEIRDIDRTELYVADEAFLCGSAMEIKGIAKVDGYDIKMGNVTEKLRKLYNKAIDGELEGLEHWVTEIK